MENKITENALERVIVSVMGVDKVGTVSYTHLDVYKRQL